MNTTGVVVCVEVGGLITEVGAECFLVGGGFLLAIVNDRADVDVEGTGRVSGSAVD